MKPSERELPLIQRGVIDNCFEEGQYEYGIDVLDKVRSQGYKPPPLHIRLLLYISLYPPPPPKRVDRADIPPSPHKGQFQRQKQDLSPKPGSRPLAIALLHAFIRTNSPECLMRALPHHSYIGSNGVKDVDPFGQEKPLEEPEDNSPLKDELLEMQSLKDCWGLIRDGFVERKQLGRYHADEDESSGPGNNVVGLYAWSILEWLIQVFEKDERRERERGHKPYSALLLCQIPPPREKTGPRWDADMPLQVAFACFSPISHALHQSNHCPSFMTRCGLGSRLISLLVNLTLTRPTLLSPTVFLSSLTTRLFDLPVLALDAFLSAIPPSHTLFKISLLNLYISTGNCTDGTNARRPGISGPRAKPKFTGKDTSDHTLFESETASTQDRHKDPYPLPSQDRILGLLSSPLKEPPKSHSGKTSLPLPSVKVALAKFYLVSALCSLHLSHKLAVSQWNAVVQKGKLRQGVLNGFVTGGNALMGSDLIIDEEVREETDEQKIKRYMTSALEMVKVWELSSIK